MKLVASLWYSQEHKVVYDRAFNQSGFMTKQYLVNGCFVMMVIPRYKRNRRRLLPTIRFDQILFVADNMRFSILHPSHSASHTS